MWNSKQKNLIFFIFGISLILLLLGCWSPGRQKSFSDQTDRYTNYILVSAEGDGNPTTEVVNESWKLPESRHYHFKACLKPRVTEQSIRGIPFLIKSEDHVIEVSTDVSGCLHWHEKAEFEPIQGEAYWPIERWIEGTGVYQGKQAVRFAINPWVSITRSGVPEVKWLRDSLETDLPFAIQSSIRGKVKMILKGSSKLQVSLTDDKEIDKNKKLSNKELWMKRVNAYVKEKKEDGRGVWVQVRLSMMPVIMFRDLVGKTNPVPLTSGRFKVDAQIVATDIGLERRDKLILTPQLPPSIGVVTEGDGVLRVDLEALMERRVAHGNLKLALRAIPIDGAPEGLKAFEGLFDISTFDKMGNNKHSDLMPDSSVYLNSDRFAYEQFLTSTSNFEELKKSRQAFELEPFEFPKMIVKFSTIRPGETATTRTVEYSIQACVRNSLTGTMVKNELFKVDYVPDEESRKLEAEFYIDEKDKIEPKPWCEVGEKGNSNCREILMTDPDGCLFTTGHVTHKYYNPEQLHYPSIRIRHVASEQGGKLKKNNTVAFEKTLDLAINPWDLFATFGRDKRELPADYIDSIRKREKIHSLLFIPQFSYHTLRFRYEIDEFMNLVVKKVLLLKLEPSVLRYASITDGRKHMGPLRDGIYLLKLAIEKDYLDPAADGVFIGFDHFARKTYLELPKEVQTKKYIYAVKKLVRVQNGTIITPVEVAVRDLRLLRIRSNFLVQLETVDEKKLTIVNSLHQELKSLNNQRVLSNPNSVETKEQYQERLQEMMAPLKKSLQQVFFSVGDQPPNRQWSKNNASWSLKDLHKIYNEELNSIDLPEDFFKGVEDLTLLAYRKNDLTNINIAPVVDLETLKDVDSGLKRRAFVGPVTLLLNSNSSYVRPLDNTEEEFCTETDDCRDLKEQMVKLDGGVQGNHDDKVYRDSPLFGSIRHLIDGSVDDLIYGNEERQIKGMVQLETEYLARSTVSSLLYNFVKQSGMKYVSLADIPLKRYDKEHCPLLENYVSSEREKKSQRMHVSLSDKDENCLISAPEASTPVDQFIKQLNNKEEKNGYGLFGIDINKEDLKNLLNNKNRDQRIDDRFCDFFSRQMQEVLKKEKSLRASFLNDWLKGLGWSCRSRQIESKGEKNFWGKNNNAKPGLIYERKIKVYETNGYRFKGGKPLNIAVGASFGLNYGHGYARGVNYNFLGDIPVVGWILRLFSLKEEQSRTNTNGTTVGEGAYLAMQEATMHVQVVDYERCIIVKLNSDMILPKFKDADFYFRDPTTGKVDNEKKEVLINQFLKGVMICDGTRVKSPLPIEEKYYYFSQHFTEGDLLDSADLYNHPWLLALRGKRDFSAFLSMIKAVPYNWDFSEVVKKEGWTIDHMMQAYRQIHPTFPGLYTILDEEDTAVQYPNRDQPKDSFGDNQLSTEAAK